MLATAVADLAKQLPRGTGCLTGGSRTLGGSLGVTQSADGAFIVLVSAVSDMRCTWRQTVPEAQCP